MEWVDFGITDIEERLAAEARMDEIDRKRERGENDGAQQD